MEKKIENGLDTGYMRKLGPRVLVIIKDSTVDWNCRATDHNSEVRRSRKTAPS